MAVTVPNVNFYYGPDHDTNDGKAWSDMDMNDLKHSRETGNSIEDAAGFLRGSRSVAEVRKKAEEMGWWPQTS